MIIWPRIQCIENTASNEQIDILFPILLKEKKILGPRFSWIYKIQSKNEVKNYLEKNYKKQQLWSRLEYFIFMNDNYIWQIFPHKIDKKKWTCKLWIWILWEYAWNWYATEAISIVEQFLAKYHNIKKVIIQCDKKNIASQNIAKKLGYSFQEGIPHYKYSVHCGDYKDMLIFSKQLL